MQNKVKNFIDINKISYPDNLPVTVLKNKIKTTIKENQVTIISGSTGSGKTTQLPKICLELGRGQKGLIGHTQPRRLAARTVASRIAQELKVYLGEQVGYQIRFTDETNENTQVKLMTDGILLNEIQTDPLLKKYDTLIIDEAHERSLNIDFILGYLSTLKTKRPDLKIIITSATIDSQKFAKHFANKGVNAPIIEVSGRTYPVEIRYRPLLEIAEKKTQNTKLKLEEQIDQVTGIIRACDELMREGRGDILVFLAGEKDIRDTQNALEDYYGEKCEILPVFSRQATHQQMKIFKPNHTKTRIVLATNIAETSLTVPGIRYVIDPGLARISRYSNKTKVQRLPIEPISQASANQRSGRCGRVQDGIAIRLYSEEEFQNRPEYTQPEILRTSLASVILKMVSIGLQDIENFPFIDKPDIKSLKNGLQQLKEIGAFKTVYSNKKDSSRNIYENQRVLKTNVKQQSNQILEHESIQEKNQSNISNTHKITKLGYQIAKMPIDPRLARMLIEADKNGCLNEVIVIVAALSMQDVRERPLEQEEISDQYHNRFNASTSDFLTYLTLWRYLQVQSKRLSGSAFRKMCKNEFFHYLRVREWVDIVNQLIELTQNLGYKSGKITLPELPKKLQNTKSNDEIANLCVNYGKSKDTPDSDQIHCSLLVGLLSSIGYFDSKKGDYIGTRGSRFTIWPGSGLFGHKYDWVMCAEIVETSRVFARTVAKISPEWIEKYARFLVKHNYYDPIWSKKAGAALIKEKVLLYGLPIISDRTVLVGRLENIDFDGISAKEYARESFIMNALVLGQWNTYHKFYRNNQSSLGRARDIQNRQRDFTLVVDEQDIFDFYDEKLPDNIISSTHFDVWWKKQKDKTILNFDDNFLYKGQTQNFAYPKFFEIHSQKLALKYVFDPQSDRDGITVKIPIDLLKMLKPEPFEWLVSGLQEELIYNIVKNLPKNIRKHLVPVPDFVNQILNFITTPKDEYESNMNIVKKVDTEDILDVTDKLKNFSGKFDDFKNLHRQLLDEAIIKAKNNKTKNIDNKNLENNLDVSSQRKDLKVKVENKEFIKANINEYKNYYANDSLYETIKQAIWVIKNIEINYEHFQEAFMKLPKHLTMNYMVVDDKGLTVFEGRNLLVLQDKLLERERGEKGQKKKIVQVDKTLSDFNEIVKAEIKTLYKNWELKNFETYPQNFDSKPIKTKDVILYPCLCLKNMQFPFNDMVNNYVNKFEDQTLKTLINNLYDKSEQLTFGSIKTIRGNKYTIELVTDRKFQKWLHENSLIYFITEKLALPIKRITTRWNGKEATVLSLNPYTTLEDFIFDAQFLAVKTLCQTYRIQKQSGLIENEIEKVDIYPNSFEEYLELEKYVKNNLEDKIYEILKICVEIFESLSNLEMEIKGNNNFFLLHTITQIKQNNDTLIYDGFLRDNNLDNVKYFSKYLQTNSYRLLKAKQNPAQDQTQSWKYQSIKDRTISFLQEKQSQLIVASENYETLYKNLLNIKYLLEEYKVSLFAQHLGTTVKISDKRIIKYIEDMLQI